MRTGFLSGSLAAAGAGLLLASSLAAARAEDATVFAGKVVRLAGGARWSSDCKNWQLLKAGDSLRSGAVVQTANGNATLDIHFGETGASAGRKPQPASSANLVRLYGETVLQINKLTSQGSGAARVEATELDLRAGRILGVLNRLPGASEFSVQFPAGIVGVQGNVGGGQGASYVLKSSGELAVLAGTAVIALTKDNAAAQAVTRDHRFDPATGQVTPLPSDAPERKLLPQARSAAAAPATPARPARHFDARGNPVFPSAQPR